MRAEDLDLAGTRLIFDNVVSTAEAAALALVCIGAGRWALRRSNIHFGALTEEIVFSATCGMGLVATEMLAACFAIGVNWGSLGLVLAGQTWLCRKEIAATARDGLRLISEALRASRSSLEHAVSTAGGFLLLAVLVGLSLAPPVDWDTLAYHLEVPREWLAAHRILLPVDNFHAAFVGLQHILYLPLLGAGSVGGPAAFNAILAVLAGFAIAAFAQEMYGRRAGRIACWLFWANPLVLLVAVTPRVDVTVILFAVVAHLAVLKALSGPASSSMLMLASVITGMTVGIKYVALAFVPAFVPLLLIGVVQASGRNLRRAAKLCAGIALGGVVGAAPWLLKNWLLVGTPLYPFLARQRLEPWLVSAYGSQFIPTEMVSVVSGVLRTIRSPFNIGDLFFRPWRLMADPGNQYSAPTLALWLLPLGVLLPRKRVAAFLAVPALIFAAVVLLQSRETNLRYLLPALPPLLIVVAAVMDHATRLSGRGGNVLVAVLLGILLAPTAIAVAARVRESPTLAYLTGRASRLDYLEHYWESGSYMPVVEWANQHLPKSSMTLALFEPRKFYLDVPMRGDVAVRNWPLVEPFAHAPGCLTDAGITHVLVNDAAVEFYEMRGMHLDRMRWTSFERYREECLQLLYTNGAFRLFAIRPIQPTAASPAGPGSTQ